MIQHFCTRYFFINMHNDDDLNMFYIKFLPALLALSLLSLANSMYFMLKYSILKFQAFTSFVIKIQTHLHGFQIMNPANPGDKGLIYNDNAAEHEVTDRENNVEEELVK